MRKLRVLAATAAVTGSLGAGLVAAGPAGATGATSVTPGAVTPTPATAGSASSYSLPFITSTALPAAGTVTFVAPAGTDFTGCPSNCSGVYAVSVGNGHSASVASAAVSNTGGSTTANQVVLTLATSTIAAGDGVTVTTTGTTNPQLASGSYQIEEYTSTDTTVASSPAYTITASEPASIIRTQGNDQSAAEGTDFATDLQVRVEDTYGNPVAGAAVTFTAPPTTDSSSNPAASGTFASCPGSPSGSPQDHCTTSTGSDGLATASTFTADDTAGTYNVSASVVTATGTGMVQFSLTNSPTPVSSVTPGTVTVDHPAAGRSGATYTITFTTGNALANNQVIQLIAPNGTTFPSCTLNPTTGCTNPQVLYGTGNPQTAAPVDYAGTQAVAGPGSSTVSPTANEIDITVQNTVAQPNFSGIPADTPVTVIVTSVTNPTKASPDYLVSEADQADQGPVGSSNYAVTPAAATHLVVDSGGGQAVPVGTAFAQPLTVTAEDAYNNPELQGTPVTFVLPDGSSHPSGTFPGASVEQTDQTDASGRATSSTITTDHYAGGWTATAELPNGLDPHTLALTNQPGPAAKLVQTTGDGQSAVVGAAFGHSLTAVVEDQYDNPVPGSPVLFQVDSTSGSAGATFAACPANPANTPDTHCVVDADSAGQATSSGLTANTVAGSFTVSASDGGDASYTLTNTPGPVQSLEVVSGAGQEAQVGTAFPSPVAVTALDGYGNPTPRVTVAFGLPTSGPGATFTGGVGYATAVTDSQGRATSPAFIANTQAGEWPFSLDVQGDPSTAVTVAEVNTVGPSFDFSARSGSGQSAHVGRMFETPITVRITDADHNPVAGQTVTFNLPASGPTGSFPGGARSATTRTNAQGVATAPAVQASLQPGSYMATAATVINGRAVHLQIALRNTDGYWLAGSDGSVQAFGDAQFMGSEAGVRLDRPIVGMAARPDGSGYWLVASDGGIFSYGKARFHGSTGGIKLDQPIVGMAATPDGGGYWLVASDGGIFAFGDARFHGSTGGTPLNRPIVGMAATPDGGGYWLVASDGGIFAFGDAHFYGSTGGIRLNRPVVGMAPAPGGHGYWLVASDGGIFSFGPSAAFYGSTGNVALSQPIVGMTTAPSGRGYWFVAHDGGMFAFGPDATYSGSGSGSGEPVIAMAEG